MGLGVACRWGMRMGCIGALLLAGCSGDDNAGAGSSDSGPSGGGQSTGGGGQSTGGGQNGGGGGAAGSSSGDASSPTSDAGSPTSFGQVVLYAPFSLDYTSFGADFTDPAHAQPDLGCMTTAYGVCHLTSCPYPQPSEAPRPHAGTITFTSPDIMGMGTITPDTNGSYPSAMSTGITFAGDESVTFAAQGDTVPAFSENVTYPLSLLMSAPQMPAGPGPAMVPRTRDLVLTWTRGQADMVLRVHSEKIVGATLRLFDCTVPSAPGTFTVPRAALQAVGMSAELTVDTYHRHTFQAGAYTVDILIGGSVLTPNKMRAIGIQLQ
jgi:hypothetical protein